MSAYQWNENPGADQSPEKRRKVARRLKRKARQELERRRAVEGAPIQLEFAEGAIARILREL